MPYSKKVKKRRASKTKPINYSEIGKSLAAALAGLLEEVKRETSRQWIGQQLKDEIEKANSTLTIVLKNVQDRW